MSTSGYDYTPLSTRDSSNSRQQNISIVAIVILVVVALVIFIVWCLKCRKKKPSNRPQSQERLTTRGEATYHRSLVTNDSVDEQYEATHTASDMNQGSVRQHTRVHGTRRRATSDMDQGSVRQHTRVHGMGRRTNYAVIHETRAIIENSALNHPVTLEGNMIRTHAMINLINSTSESRSEPIMINQSGLPPMYHELERRKSLNAPQSPTPPSYEEFMAMPDKYSNCP